MSTPGQPSSRAADTDRFHIAQLLGEAAEQGQLAPEDYRDRLSKAYAAQTQDDLERISADLPCAFGSHRPAGESKPAPSTLLLAIFSGFQRRGRWNVPKRLTTFTLWGGGVVDLRYADFTCADVEINAYSIMGGQTILLPPEVNVEIKGHGVMGGFDHEINRTGTPGAPTVTIRGFSLWGGVGIKRRQRSRGD